VNCLIVAAGQGTRLREKGESKPLIRIKGIPLIERVISVARSAGVDAFYVVSGYRGENLREALDELAARDGLSISHIVNDDWERANGMSVYKARALLQGPFLLTMCDHLVDPDIIRDLLEAEHEADTVTLGVDFNVDNPLNDPLDVTRVKCRSGRIENIGKVIKDFNAIDTGLFLCTPIIFNALEASFEAGDESISGAMSVLARWGKARTFDIGGRLWIDVDDPAAFAHTERLIEEGRL
jgi:1L-myo-inositol 1-phosphate cytidylyltransferase